MEWNISKNNFAQLTQCVQEILTTISNQTDSATILALRGDLGAGKTAFVQAVATELGVRDIVTSPTFTIMKRYQPERQFTSLVHIDAYRFEQAGESTPLHFAEMFSESHTLVCIEWPERIETLIPATAHDILITIEADEMRRIVLSRPAT